MFKMVFFLWRLEHMTQADFIDYYETRHAPLMANLVPQGLDFRRNYPTWGAGAENALESFDVMTQVSYGKRADFEKVLAVAADLSVSQPIAEDEAKFEQRDRMKLFVVDEQLDVDGAGEWRPGPAKAPAKLLRFIKAPAGSTIASFRTTYEADIAPQTRLLAGNFQDYRRNFVLIDDPMTFMGGHHNRDAVLPKWHRFDLVEEFWFADATDAYRARDTLRAQAGLDITGFAPVDERAQVLGHEVGA